MQKLNPLNAKAQKHFLSTLQDQYGIKSLPPGRLFSDEENNFFLFTGELGPLGGHTKVNSLGLYLGELRHEQFRMSIEGSQIFGPIANENIVSLTQEQAKQWFFGEESTVESSDGMKIISFGPDFIGGGKVKNKNLGNYCPKARRCDVH